MGGKINKKNLDLITIRVNPKDKQRLEKLANEDRRPLSNFIRIIVEDWLRDHSPQGPTETKPVVRPRRK